MKSSRAPGVLESLGVSLPGDSAQALCQLISMTCGHTHPSQSTRPKQQQQGVYPKRAHFFSVCTFHDGPQRSAVCARGGDTSSRRWLQSWPRTSTTVPHGDRGRPGQGREREKNYTATPWKDAPSPRRLVPSTLRWTPGRTLGRHQPPGGQHRCLRCCRRRGYSSAP